MSDRGRGRAVADGRLDDGDQRVLDLVAAAWRLRDPVPPGLVADVAFAVGCHELDVEVAGILAAVGRVGAAPVHSAVRSADDAVRTLTFTTTRTTIMVQVTGTGGGRQRLDGWVEPVPGGVVRLQVGARTHDGDVSDAGRFQFVDLARGTMRLVLFDDDGAPTTVTPAFEW